jgi:hypothetical protein
MKLRIIFCRSCLSYFLLLLGMLSTRPIASGSEIEGRAYGHGPYRKWTRLFASSKKDLLKIGLSDEAAELRLRE